jgi:hypothetical protein
VTDDLIPAIEQRALADTALALACDNLSLTQDQAKCVEIGVVTAITACFAELHDRSLHIIEVVS